MSGHDFMPISDERDLRCVHCDAKPGHRAADLPCEYSPMLDALEDDELEDKTARLSALIERRFG